MADARQTNLATVRHSPELHRPSRCARGKTRLVPHRAWHAMPLRGNTEAARTRGERRAHAKQICRAWLMRRVPGICRGTIYRARQTNLATVRHSPELHRPSRWARGKSPAGSRRCEPVANRTRGEWRADAKQLCRAWHAMPLRGNTEAARTRGERRTHAKQICRASAINIGGCPYKTSRSFDLTLRRTNDELSTSLQ